MAKIFLSGIQIPTLSDLNIDGEFTLDAASGTSGHMLVSQGAGNTPAWSNTLTSPTITTSLLTGSTSFNLLTSTATTINFGSAATTMTIGYTGTGTSTTNISTGAVNLSTKTVNIGTGGSGTSTTNINIGATGTTTINGSLTAPVPTLPSQTANTIFASPNGSAGTPTFRNLSVNDIYPAGPPSTYGQVIQYAPVGGGMAWTSTAPLLTGGGTMTGALTLAAGTNAPLVPLKFTSNTTTPAATAGGMDYDGTVFYSTPNATTGRAVDVASYYYVSDGAYAVDHSLTSTAKSIFGSATTGLTLIAGTTYEYELNVYVSNTVVGTSSPSWSHSFLLTTVSGSPTTTIYQEIRTSSNTTSQATSSTVSRLRNINNAAVVVQAAVTTGSRHSMYNSKGIIRVTGTGSVEISPAATASATSADYSFVPLAGSYIKITPIGNGTVAGIGAWA